jgi:PAS domain S-box-containing protein
MALRRAGPRFVIEVGDSGPGVPEDKRQEVFARFRQLDTEPRRRFAGTGLGLAIVKEFTALLRGDISIDSAPEGGALFVLTLPCVAPPGATVRVVNADQPVDARDVDHIVGELRRPSAAPAADTAPDNERQPLVLIVEDSRDMSTFIAESLRSEGFRVATAFDGREGYAKALEQHPDLVLTDIMMPVMSGDEMVRVIRQHSELDSIPIVVLSAKADDAPRLRLLREGAQDYVDKPFLAEELRVRVRNLVARKRAEEAGTRLRQQIEAVTRASLSVSEAIASLPETSVRAVLRTIALNAQTIARAEFAAVGIGSDPESPFELWEYAGMSDQLATQIGRVPRPVGVLRLALGDRRTVRLRDLSEDPDYRGVPGHHPAMTSFLATSIRYHGRTEGTLYLANKRDADEFTEDDERLVEMLADRVGVAIETARLYAAEGRQREWLQAVIDQMPNGVMLMDAEGRITAQNRSLFGLVSSVIRERDRFGNALAFDLRHPTGERLSSDELPITKALVRREITHGQELVARRDDGRLVPLVVSAAPIRTSRAELAGAVMILQDVSTIKELEHLREEWASIVAHDLQQPLSTIFLRCQLLLESTLGENQLDDVRQIAAATARLRRMVGDLMDASLVETHRLKVTLDRIDLGPFVRDVVQRMPEAARRTTVEIPTDNPICIKGDAQRLEQVLINLLSNALKYGAPDTEVRLEVRQRDGNAEILVSNRGPGIPSDEIPLVFQRYVRARAAGTASGSGLGLYIAEGLVKAHGGKIWVESTPGETTTFFFTVPLDQPPVSSAMAM